MLASVVRQKSSNVENSLTLFQVQNFKQISIFPHSLPQIRKMDLSKAISPNKLYQEKGLPMKKQGFIVLLALAFAGAVSIPVMADTNPVPTQPPTKTVQIISAPALLLADTNPVPTQPPTKTVQEQSEPVLILADTNPVPTQPPTKT
jgi:hypothetical protein